MVNALLLLGVSVFPLQAGRAEALPKSSAAADSQHSRPPEDTGYWRYADAYRNQATVMLLVSGGDDAGLKNALEQVKTLISRGVAVSAVAVTKRSILPELQVGGALAPAEWGNRRPSNSMAAKAVRPNSLGALVQAAGLQGGQLADMTTLAEKLSIKYSPAWIVRFRGKTLVFEGMHNPATLFSADGSFQADLNGIATESRRTPTAELLFAKPATAIRTTLAAASANPPADLKSFAASGAFPEAFANAALVFTIPSPNAATSDGSYDGLEKCSSQKVFRLPLAGGGARQLAIDLIVFDYFDNAQRSKADRSTHTSVAYVPGDLANPMRPQNDQLPALARLVHPRCLPTRVVALKEGSEEYLEYREGSSAWE